jgi:hypothetical protein
MAGGMLMLAFEAPAPDALAVLRGYAYGAGRTADDVAIDLVERRLQPDQLREDAEATSEQPDPWYVSQGPGACCRWHRAWRG